MENLKRWKKCGGLLVLILVCLVTPAEAILKDHGPIDGFDGYPEWYRDLSTNVVAGEQAFPQGLPVELCDSMTQNGNGYLCNLLPEDPDPANGAPGYNPALARDFATNFPHESFYFMADAAMVGSDFSDAGLTIGLEAAFGADVAPGNQITFARIRVRVDITTPGNYRITHPYGVLNFPNVPAGTRTINYTDDVGIGNPGDFSGALAGAIGPFLTWDTEFPVIVGDELFIGDPAVPHTVTGSPFDTNFFRIERVDAQGNTLSLVETPLFNIVGKIYTTPIASPLAGTRASYVRSAAGAHIFVFAEADMVSNAPPGLSNLQVSAAGIDPIQMNTDGAGNFFAQLTTAADALPASVFITNVGDVPPNQIEVPVTDEVYINTAIYNSDTQTLTLGAMSSDSFAPPTLSSSYGALVDGLQLVSDLPAPLPEITIVSSANGQDTEHIVVTSADLASGQVVFPAGGETLQAGDQVLVEWMNFSPEAVLFRLHYFDEDGTPHVVGSVTGATSFLWTVPDVIVEEAGKTFRVVAFDLANNRLDVAFSDGSFTIVPDPTAFILTAPVNGDVLTSGTIVNVEWTPSPGASSYRLVYFDQDGTLHPIATLGNVTSYLWTVPAVVAEETSKRLRVVARDVANTVIDIYRMDGTFSIQPAPVP